MIDERTRQGNVGIFHDDPARSPFVRMHKRSERRATFVLNASCDIKSVHLEEQLGHLSERRWAPCIHTMLESGGPSQQEKVSIVRVMVRMVVGNEYMTDCIQRDAGPHKLDRNSVSAIHHIGDAVDQNHLRWGRPARSGPRSAGSP